MDSSKPEAQGNDKTTENTRIFSMRSARLTMRCFGRDDVMHASTELYDATEVSIAAFAGCKTNAFFGPRLRATRTRIRSIISAAEHAPLGRKTSAESIDGT
jgi:hypothetical protein